jgi:NADH-quinone oxidoreductase subunit I
MKTLQKAYHGVKGLLSGMALTIGYFLRFDKVITQQYPENREQLKLPPRTRSRIELVKDDKTGSYVCGACCLCVRACPNGSIQVERTRDPQTQKAKLDRFVYHFERCTVCGMCVDACHSEALTVGKTFENAVYESAELTLILNQETPEGKPLPITEAKAPEAAPSTPPAAATPSSPTPPQKAS